MKQNEIVEVTATDVACDGGKGALGHPRVFLHIDDHAGQVQCPYCSCLYLLKAEHAA